MKNTRKYNHEYYLAHKEQITEKNNRWRKAHPESHQKSQKKWLKTHYEQALLYSREHQKEIRLKVIDLLGGAKCVYCGCNDIRVLEINHKNGGGWKERYWGRKSF